MSEEKLPGSTQTGSGVGGRKNWQSGVNYKNTVT